MTEASHQPLQRNLLLLLCLFLLAGCASLGRPLEPPRVTLVNLAIIDAQLFEQRYAITLRIQNPNDYVLDLKGLSFAVELNGRDFAQGVSADVEPVPAFGETTLELVVSSSLFDLVNQLEALQRRGGSGIEYRIHGKISTSNRFMSLPFERKGWIGAETAEQ